MANLPLLSLSTETNVASRIYEAFNGYSSPSLYGTVNGNLEYTNIRDTRNLSYLQIQSETFAGGSQVGGSANMDFFSGASDLEPGAGWFSGIIDPNSRPKAWLSIPGACAKMYVPYDSHVLVLWTVTWANDSQINNETGESHICLFVDDDPAAFNTSTTLGNNPLARRLRRGQFGNEEDLIGSTPSGYDRIQDRYKGRTYSGHFLVDLSTGFHDIGLKLCTTGLGKNRLKTTKIRSRSLKYIYFRKGAAF